MVYLSQLTNPSVFYVFLITKTLFLKVLWYLILLMIKSDSLLFILELCANRKWSDPQSWPLSVSIESKMLYKSGIPPFVKSPYFSALWRGFIIQLNAKNPCVWIAGILLIKSGFFILVKICCWYMNSQNSVSRFHYLQSFDIQTKTEKLISVIQII